LQNVRLTFLALPLFLVPLVYGSVYNTSSLYEAYAAPRHPNFGTGACGYSYGPNWSYQSCCWKEGGIVSPEYIVCQTCSYHYIPHLDPLPIELCGDLYTPQNPPFTLPPPGVTGPLGGTVDPTPFILPPRGVTGPLGGAVGPVGPNILPFNLRDILTLPENQSYSISVQHGPNSDTIRIEIPKTLSSSILNQTATGFEIPKALSSSILNQTAAGFEIPKALSSSILNQTAAGFD
jgi:hypothetical protein